MSRTSETLAVTLLFLLLVTSSDGGCQTLTCISSLSSIVQGLGWREITLMIEDTNEAARTSKELTAKGTAAAVTTSMGNVSHSRPVLAAGLSFKESLAWASGRPPDKLMLIEPEEGLHIPLKLPPHSCSFFLFAHENDEPILRRVISLPHFDSPVINKLNLTLNINGHLIPKAHYNLQGKTLTGVGLPFPPYMMQRDCSWKTGKCEEAHGMYRSIGNSTVYLIFRWFTLKMCV